MKAWQPFENTLGDEISKEEFSDCVYHFDTIDIFLMNLCKGLL